MNAIILCNCAVWHAEQADKAAANDDICACERHSAIADALFIRAYWAAKR